VVVEGYGAMAIRTARPWRCGSRTMSAVRWTSGNADDRDCRRDKVDGSPADDRVRAGRRTSPSARR
jgi:hypothetical protein